MIYLCIPAYNEEQTVGVVLWKIRQVLTDFPRDYQILVADDASTDRTADVLAPYARVLPLTVLRARERRGYAASLEMLLREAVRRSDYPKRDTVVTLQADFTDEPEDIVPLIKKIEQGADIVGGTRASDRRPELLERLLLGWQRRLLRRAAWPDGAGDPLSGFRSYRVHTVARALEAAKDKRLLHWDGAIADAELLRTTAPHARRVESIDLVFRPDRRQRATRASSWERLKGLRRFVRGAAAVGTVPLTELSPETVPPPRPLEIERERRSEASATAANGRNGRNGARRGGGRGAAAPPGGGRTRPERTRRERPSGSPQITEGGARKPRRSRSGAQPEGRTTGESVAPDAATQGNQGSDPAGSEGAAPKKRRRRRRRKSGTRASEPTPQAPAGESGTDDVSRGISETSDAEATADDGGAADGAPKKRRRRGGRRGGRGRRRKATAESGASPAESGGESAAPKATPPAISATREAEHVSVGERNDQH